MNEQTKIASLSWKEQTVSGRWLLPFADLVLSADKNNSPTRSQNSGEEIGCGVRSWFEASSTSGVMADDEADTTSQEEVTVGGSKGHEKECIRGNLLLLYRAYRWKMIPRCTGRYTCRDHQLVSQMTPSDIVENAGIGVIDDDNNQNVFMFELPGRADPIVVIPLDDLNRTGVITYIKKNATTSYVHTLNTTSGFRRKLEAIGITATDFSISI